MDSSENDTQKSCYSPISEENKRNCELLQKSLDYDEALYGNMILDMKGFKC